MDRKIRIRRAVCLLLAAACLACGITWENRFCLGDGLLEALGLPAWSQGTQGFHYSALIALIGTPVFFWLFASTTKDRKKTMSNLLVGTVALMWVLSLLQRM